MKLQFNYFKINDKLPKNTSINFNIKINKNKLSYSNKLTNKKLLYKHIFNLFSLSKSKVLITNFPNINEIYSPTSSTEHFKITPKGLVSYKPISPINKLQNSILIKNSFNNDIAKIEFDATNRKFIITYTGENSDNIPPNMDFFILRLKHITTERIIKIAEILPGENGGNFSETLNNFNFAFDENFLELEYFLPSKIVIANYPNKGDMHIPTAKKEFYLLTDNGFIAYTTLIEPKPPIPVSISIPQEIYIGILGTIKFNSENLKLTVFSFQVFANLYLYNTAYLLFKLRNSNEQIKYHALYKADEILDKFAEKLNNREFTIGDIIELDCISDQSLKIKNFPSLGGLETINSKFSNLEGVKKFLKITESGLKDYIPINPLQLDTLQNIIRINNITNVPVIEIQFNTLDKVLRILKFSTEIDTSSNYDYLTFKLFDLDNLLICNSILKSNNMLQEFLDEVNFKIFDYNYVIELTYNEKSRNFINITNFPSENDVHSPTVNLERYEITNVGLKAI